MYKRQRNARAMRSARGSRPPGVSRSTPSMASSQLMTTPQGEGSIPSQRPYAPWMARMSLHGRDERLRSIASCEVERQRSMIAGRTCEAGIHGVSQEGNAAFATQLCHPATIAVSREPSLQHPAALLARRRESPGLLPGGKLQHVVVTTCIFAIPPAAFQAFRPGNDARMGIVQRNRSRQKP